MAGPTLFIVGAPRCGTTTLFRLLAEHPQIAASKVKEPYFLHVCVPRPSVAALVKARGEPAPYMAEEWERDVRQIGEVHARNYEGLWAGSNVKHRMEATPCYLFDKMVPGLMAKRYPQARIVVLVRHPVMRALSHWKMLLRARKESLEDPQAAFEAEPAEVDEFFWGMRTYIRHSLYGRQLERYLGLFPREQVKVLVYEEFYQNPAALQELHRWLGVVPRGATDWKKPRVSKADPKFVDEWMERVFREEVRKLEELIGREIEAWR